MFVMGPPRPGKTRAPGHFLFVIPCPYPLPPPTPPCPPLPPPAPFPADSPEGPALKIGGKNQGLAPYGVGVGITVKIFPWPAS